MRGNPVAAFAAPMMGDLLPGRQLWYCDLDGMQSFESSAAAVHGPIRVVNLSGC